MKQVFLLKGRILIHDIPKPNARNGQVLVRTSYSCISAGTEMASVADSSKSLVRKAIEKPRAVVNMLKTGQTRGLSTMLNIIRGSSFGYPIGYSGAGVVVESRAVNDRFIPGQLVAIMGTKYANHAEYNAVPENLVVAIPRNVSIEDASTAALGATCKEWQLMPKVGESCCNGTRFWVYLLFRYYALLDAM